MWTLMETKTKKSCRKHEVTSNLFSPSTACVICHKTFVRLFIWKKIQRSLQYRLQLTPRNINNLVPRYFNGCNQRSSKKSCKTCCLLSYNPTFSSNPCPPISKCPEALSYSLTHLFAKLKKKKWQGKVGPFPLRFEKATSNRFPQRCQSTFIRYMKRKRESKVSLSAYFDAALALLAEPLTKKKKKKRRGKKICQSFSCGSHLILASLRYNMIRQKEKIRTLASTANY